MNNHLLQDFLAHSRANPHYLAPFSVTLASGGRIEVWDSGVLCIEPARSKQQRTKDIIISCGIHGNETAPIEMCERLLADIVSGRLVCMQRLLLIFGNLEGMNLAVREVDENLNRLFCGEHSKGTVRNKERQRAAKLEQYVTRFYQATVGVERRHYDLHTAIRASKHEQFAVYPYMASHTYARDLLAFLAAAGIDNLLLSHALAPTFSCFTAQRFGALSLTIELGKVMPFGQNPAGRLDQLQQCLASELSQLNWRAPQLALEKLQVFQVCQEITKYSTQFCFHFSAQVANFTCFAPGTLLATDEQQAWRVADQEEAVIFPNAQVTVGHRAALMAVVTELTEEMLH